MMVTKNKTSEKKASRVKVGKLKLNKETVKDLAGSQQKQIKGGVVKKATDTKEGYPGCY